MLAQVHHPEVTWPFTHYYIITHYINKVPGKWDHVGRCAESARRAKSPGSTHNGRGAFRLIFDQKMEM